MGEALDVRVEKAPPVRYLPVSEAGIPLAARFTLAFPTIEHLSLKAEADAAEREQSKAIVEEALRYTPPLVEQFQAGLTGTTAFLLANGIRTKVEGQKLKDRVAQEIRPYNFSSYRDPRAEEVTKSVTREVMQAVHPDAQDTSTRDAVPTEWVAEWIEAATRLQANPNYNDANRFLLESKPRYFTKLVMGMFASGMTVDQIVQARPTLVGEFERLRYIAHITQRNPQKGHISLQEAERKATSMRRDADIEARAVCGGALYITLDMMVDLCQQAGMEAHATSLTTLRDSSEVGAGRMGGAAEFRKKQFMGTYEPSGAVRTGQVLEERLLQMPQLVHTLLVRISEQVDASSEDFQTAFRALQGAIWNLNGTAQSYNEALARDAVQREASRGSRYNFPEENFSKRDSERIIFSNYKDENREDFYKQNKNY